MGLKVNSLTGGISTTAIKLLTKGLAHTTRIKTLPKLFISATFIHIYRNLYTVFYSFKHICKKLTEVWRLQDFELESVENYILPIYQDITARRFEWSASIPTKNLVEICYNHFEANLVEGLNRIYNELSRPGFKLSRQQIKDYITAPPTYTKNFYNLNQSTLNREYSHWYFTIEKWECSYGLNPAT